MEISNKIFADNYSWVSINTSLNDFKRISVSAPKYPMNFDDSTILDSVLYNELFHSILKTILSELYKTQNCDYIDLTKFNLSYYGIEERIVNIINNYDYKTVITNGNLHVHMQSHISFTSKIIDTTLNIGTYQSGYMLGKSIWTDPYIKYNDNKICLFNDVELNISNFKKDINEDKITLNVDYAYKVKDSKMIYILLDKNEEAYKDYIAYIRDKKIDDLLKL